jgi:PAS domain S-box-containing protein
MKNFPNTILVIEDDFGLNDLICEKIRDCGFETHCATTVPDAVAWLIDNTPALMLVDYNLDGVTAFDFIDEIRARGLHLAPFVVATGQGDERIAVDMMKLGARDYVIKDANLLELLPVVVQRIMAELEHEVLLHNAQRETELTKQTYVDIFNTITEAIFIVDENDRFLDVNNGAIHMYRMSKDELLGIDPTKLGAPDMNNVAMLTQQLNAVRYAATPCKFEFWAMRSDGEVFPKEVVISKGKYFGRNVVIATARDITERKQHEDALRKKIEELEYLNKFMINRELRMIEMKKEVNELLVQMGQEKRYL